MATPQITAAIAEAILATAKGSIEAMLYAKDGFVEKLGASHPVTKQFGEATTLVVAGLDRNTSNLWNGDTSILSVSKFTNSQINLSAESLKNLDSSINNIKFHMAIS